MSTWNVAIDLTRQEATADRDVIGTVAKRNIHGDRFAGTERHGHGLALSAGGFD